MAPHESCITPKKVWTRLFAQLKLDGMGFGTTPTVLWDEMEAGAGEGREKRETNLYVLHPTPQTPRILAFGSFATAYAVDREQ